jgi:branched-chain amino acid aminotransferase
MNPGLAFCDGAVRTIEECTVSVLDRTVQWGLGAFETVRLHGGRPFLLERHLARLGRSLGSVGLPVPPAVATLTAGLPELARRADAPSALVRIMVTAGAAAGGPGPRVMAILRPVPPVENKPVVIGVAPFVRDARAPLSGVKSLSYLDHYLQRERAEAEGRVDDLLLDTDGHVTEATVSNAFAVRGGRLVTPPVAGILPGVTRGVILELAAEEGVPVDERPLPRGELQDVDEFFITGAGKCLVIADVVDGRQLPAARPVARRLREALVRRIARECAVPAESVRF